MNEHALEAARAAHRAELAELHEQLERTRHLTNCGPTRRSMFMRSANRLADARLSRLLSRLSTEVGDPPASWPYSYSPDWGVTGFGPGGRNR